MTWPLPDVSEGELVQWIEENAGKPLHARGYQGSVYLFERGERRLIIKVASDGPGRWLRRAWLKREYRTYQRLIGFPGSPRCYGLIDNRYLVLEYVDGVALKRAQLVDRDAFFATLLDYILELHRRGVAHADLKRQDNLLVVNGRLPRLIDFGAAIVRRDGLAPINRYLYGLARQFDLNAWVKLKYRGDIDAVTAADRVYYRRTGIENVARAIKRGYLRVKGQRTS